MKTLLGILLFVGTVGAIGCSGAGPAPPPPPPKAPGTGAPADRPPIPPPSPFPTLAPPPVIPTSPPHVQVAPVAPVEPAVAATGVPGGSAPPGPPFASPAPSVAVPPQPPAALAAPRPYLDIVRLKQAGFSDEFLLNKIRTDSVNYQLTTPEILDLRSSGVTEAVVEAMLRSGQPSTASAVAPMARRAEFNGLARVGKGFLVFGTSTKNRGRLIVDGETVSWYDSEDPKKNFSIYVKNLKEVFDTCVLRPGQNLCLEFGVVTYTGEEYRFRDPGWKNGENRLVTEATNYFRQAFPALPFSQRAVSEL